MIENTNIHKDIIHKEIDLIQNVIKRMTKNSFLAIGWMITLLGVITALCKDHLLAKTGDNNETSVYIYILMCLPIIVFWYLDAYFLLQERFYRHLYNWAIAERIKGNFENLYGLIPQIQFKHKKNVKTVWQVITSETLLVFYSSYNMFGVNLLHKVQSPFCLYCNSFNLSNNYCLLLNKK